MRKVRMEEVPTQEEPPETGIGLGDCPEAEVYNRLDLRSRQ